MQPNVFFLSLARKWDSAQPDQYRPCELESGFAIWKWHSLRSLRQLFCCFRREKLYSYCIWIHRNSRCILQKTHAKHSRVKNFKIPRIGKHTNLPFQPSFFFFLLVTLIIFKFNKLLSKTKIVVQKFFFGIWNFSRNRLQCCLKNSVFLHYFCLYYYYLCMAPYVWEFCCIVHVCRKLQASMVSLEV